MSLVDYAASSDEDEPQPPADEQPKDKRLRVGVSEEGPSTSAPPNDAPVPAHNRMSMNLELPSSEQRKIVSDQSSELKLPDASFLLNSPMLPSNQLNSLDHSSRVAAAMAESAARKRELKGASASYPRNKVPKGTLPHSKNVPETVGGHLVPPQLSGRSNVVTEDISKLFLKKNTSSAAE
ncbi:hypothetical protein ACS0TY_020004 [Phlomoides rotata]